MRRWSPVSNGLLPAIDRYGGLRRAHARLRCGRFLDHRTTCRLFAHGCSLHPASPGRFADTRPEAGRAGTAATVSRSEAHTSELQSREKIVCQPLLAKTK